MQHFKPLSVLVLLPLLVTPALAQTSGQSVKVVKGTVSGVENVELKSDDNSGGGAVVGGAIGYNLGSGRSQTEKRRAAIVGAGMGAAAGSPQKRMGVRYTVTAADGSTVAVVSAEELTIKQGSCVSVEQSADRSSIREVEQAVCDLEMQTSTVGPATQPAKASGSSENCEAAQQQLLDATTAEALELANSKVQILCD